MQAHAPSSSIPRERTVRKRAIRQDLTRKRIVVRSLTHKRTVLRSLIRRRIARTNEDESVVAPDFQVVFLTIPVRKVYYSLYSLLENLADSEKMSNFAADLLVR